MEFIGLLKKEQWILISYRAYKKDMPLPQFSVTLLTTTVHLLHQWMLQHPSQFSV